MRDGQSWTVIFASAALCALASCSRPRPITVAVLFETRWTFRGESLVDRDRSVVVQTTLDTLRRAFDGFAVLFVDQPLGDRTIRVEETPYTKDPRQLITFGAAGLTYPASRVSSVRIDVLFNEELAAAHCSAIVDCSRPRVELMRALGRGVG